MKIRYVCRRKSILVLVVGTIICWTVTGNAFEQGDAKASARVNLRGTPSLSGEILSIIPNGHKVRIMDKKGLWCKVDVEGEIKGKGWVYAKYLERILPKALKTESSTQTVRVDTASWEQKQGIHHVEPPPNARTDGAEVKPLKAPLPGKTSIAGVKEQSSARRELAETKNEIGVLSKVEMPIAGEPVHLPPAQAPYSGFKQDAPGISGKYSSGVIEQRDSRTYQKSLPGEKKEHGGALQETSPAVSEQSVSDARAVASFVIRSAVSHERKKLINKRESMEPIAIALKLLSIVLSCLVILLFYKKKDVKFLPICWLASFPDCHTI